MTDKNSMKLVTLGGECFEAAFQREMEGPLSSAVYYHFHITDMTKNRGKRPVSVVGDLTLQVVIADYDSRVSIACLNVIRRAFDSGMLSFDSPFDGRHYQQLRLGTTDLQKQLAKPDSDVRQYIIHKAYWLAYHSPTQAQPDDVIYPVPFDEAADLDYLGVEASDVKRMVRRLANQGLLEKVLEGNARPTEKLLSEYEAGGGLGLGLKDVAPEASKQPTDRVGSATPGSPLLIFISHSSRDATLAEALIDLLKGSLGIVADQIRCSSVDGYRLPVGVNTENQLREEVRAAKVVIGLITPSSLRSDFVMFELGARWGANLYLAPLVAGVKINDLSAPLSLLNAVSAENDSQIHQLLQDISKCLGLRLQGAAGYVHDVANVKRLASTTAEAEAPPSAVAAKTLSQTIISLSAEGTPLLRSLRSRRIVQSESVGWNIC